MIGKRIRRHRLGTFAEETASILTGDGPWIVRSICQTGGPGLESSLVDSRRRPGFDPAPNHHHLGRCDQRFQDHLDRGPIHHRSGSGCSAFGAWPMMRPTRGQGCVRHRHWEHRTQLARGVRRAAGRPCWWGRWFLSQMRRSFRPGWLDGVALGVTAALQPSRSSWVRFGWASPAEKFEN